MTGRADRRDARGSTGRLEAVSLSVSFPLQGARLTAVDGVSLAVDAGESVGLVGESGCGKTTLARSLLGLQRPDSGEILLDGAALPRRRTPAERRAVQIVFQDPASSLNPRLSVRRVLRELLTVHRLASGAALETRCRELLDLVGLPAAALDGYPGSFSGGQRQRIAIARALAVEPRFLIADEPTSALDVSVQASILDLLEAIRGSLGIGILFISHNLAAVRHLCERVAVMYLGRVVESAPRAALFGAPRHPYTQALLDAAPRIRPSATGRRLLGGEAPSALARPSGCALSVRCVRAESVCERLDPQLEALARTPEHLAACHFRDEFAPLRLVAG
jgi:oligopeptide/dipeptide ABC transporter ATP-binding protein